MPVISHGYPRLGRSRGENRIQTSRLSSPRFSLVAVPSPSPPTYFSSTQISYFFFHYQRSPPRRRRTTRAHENHSWQMRPDKGTLVIRSGESTTRSFLSLLHSGFFFTNRLCRRREMESNAIESQGGRQKKQAWQPRKGDIATRLSPGDKGAGTDYLSRRRRGCSFHASSKRNDMIRPAKMVKWSFSRVNYQILHYQSRKKE